MLIEKTLMFVTCRKRERRKQNDRKKVSKEKKIKKKVALISHQNCFGRGKIFKQKIKIKINLQQHQQY